MFPNKYTASNRQKKNVKHFRELLQETDKVVAAALKINDKKEAEIKKLRDRNTKLSDGLNILQVYTTRLQRQVLNIINYYFTH